MRNALNLGAARTGSLLYFLDEENFECFVKKGDVLDNMVLEQECGQSD